MPKVMIEIDKSALQGIPLDDKGTICSIFKLGLTQFKIEQILALYKHGGMSIGYAAKLAGVTEQEMIRHAVAQGITPKFSEKTLREELE